MVGSDLSSLANIVAPVVAQLIFYVGTILSAINMGLCKYIQYADKTILSCILW